MNRREMISGLAGMLGLAGVSKVAGAIEPEGKPLGELGAKAVDGGPVGLTYSRECEHPLRDYSCKLGRQVARDDARLRGRVRRPGVDYCRAGESPGWLETTVMDLDTGLEVEDVTEVDCVDGWLTRYALTNDEADAIDGITPHEYLKLRVVRGRFKLVPVDTFR